MAVPEQTPYIEHTGNGVTTSFSLGFQCESKDHLIVLVDDIEPPIATWSLTGGNVVFTTAPAAGKKITLQRNTPFNRNAEYQSFNNSFRPQTVNIDFDRIWWKLQELGVADWLMKLYVDRLHQQQEQKINDLKGYVDDRDDELRAYLIEEIRKQGVALDQLEDYYNYLMQRLAQIAVDKGWDASFVVDASGEAQQQVNYNGGSKWHSRVGGYKENERVVLANGDIVKSTVDGNANDPNVDMTGWEFSNSPNSIITVNSVAEMLSLRVFDGLTVRTKSYNAPNLALAKPYHGGMTYVYRSARSSENDSGSVINGWVALFPNNQVVNVDWFGADPTNTIDSTNAVLAAGWYACGDLTSNFKAGVTKRATIEYSAGIYKQGNIPIISCCTYKGQGKFSTQIIPSDTAEWVFRSIGSYEGATISTGTRVIYSSIKEMTIGYGYVSSIPIVNKSAGGIYREAGSWNQIENVAILGLGGNGLKLIGDFDSDFNYLTIMSVGYAQALPALHIDRSTGSGDGSNAMSFRRLHIEGCYQHFYIGRNSRHVWFDWAKFEHCTVSSVIEDNQGIIFDNLECSVSQTGFPWINVIASSGYSPFVVEFNNPSLIGVGWFINNTTSFKVKINGGSGRRVNKLATGKNLIIDGIYTYDCGAQLMTLGFSTIKNCKFSAQKTTTITDGTADCIILTDSGNKVIDCEFDGQGNSSDGVAFVNITASPNSKIIDNDFGTGKQYGIRGSATVNQRDNNYSNTAFTGTNVNYTSLVNTNNVGFNSSGGTKSVFSVINADTTGTITNIIAGASILSIRDANLALIGIVFADSSGRINIVMQNGTQTALLGTGSSGDGKIYLRASGASLVVENRTSSQLRLTVLSQSAA